MRTQECVDSFREPHTVTIFRLLTLRVAAVCVAIERIAREASRLRQRQSRISTDRQSAQPTFEAIEQDEGFDARREHAHGETRDLRVEHFDAPVTPRSQASNREIGERVTVHQILRLGISGVTIG